MDEVLGERALVRVVEHVDDGPWLLVRLALHRHVEKFPYRAATTVTSEDIVSHDLVAHAVGIDDPSRHLAVAFREVD